MGGVTAIKIPSFLRIRLAPAEMAFVGLRALTLAGSLTALLLVPVRPEHEVHLLPLLAFFVLYKVALFLVSNAWPNRMRVISLAAIGMDSVVVFFLLWFTGGPESHFYLLFYLLIALNALYFGVGVGSASALAATLLYSLAYWLNPPAASLPGHLTSRLVLFWLMGVPLGFLSDRERGARAEAEGANRDLREALDRLREAQERLLHSERLATMGKMAAKVAHEIRNPLGSISLNVELLEDEIRACPGPTMPQSAELLTAIKGQIDLLTGLTEEYLRFARLPKPAIRPEDPAEILDELVQFFGVGAEERGIAFRRDVPEEVPKVLVDRKLFIQALLNLLRNALDATAREGTVTLSILRRGEMAEVRIADQGIGIPEEHLGKIFDPFFTTKEGGTGLGLTIARQIIAEQGGHLTCASAVGTGTTFTVTIPVAGEGPRR